MSYLQIEIKGKKYGLKFTNLSAEEFNKKSSKDGNDMSVKNIYAIYWAGLLTNAYRKDEELDLSFEDVCDYADTLIVTAEGQEEIKKVVDIFNDALSVKNDKKEEDTTEKKNQIAMPISENKEDLRLVS